jgi:hypothetical protein
MNTPRTTLHIVIVLAIAAIAIGLYTEWRVARADRQRLATQLAAAEKVLAQAADSQQTRDAQLKETLTQIAERASKNLQPADIVRDLSSEAGLPKPITAASPSPQSQPPAEPVVDFPQQNRLAASAALDFARPQAPPNSSQAGAPGAPAQIPPEDLKPLYDFVMECKACQAKLAVVQGDLGDEQTKSAALARERDAALQAARGGSFWTRARRAAKWFVIGAAVGAAAAALR